MIKIEAIDVLQQNDDIFNTTNNPFIYCLRFFWYIIYTMQLIVSSLESALNEIFKHLDFFNSTKMLSFMQSIKPITSALLVIGILIIGFKVMTNTLKEKKGILLNFIFVVIIFSGFQTLLVQFSNLTTTSANAFMNISGSNVSLNIVQNSIIDLKYLDENNFSDSAIQKKNNINPQNIMKIDPVELMKPKETNNKQVFENKLVIDTSGNISTKKLDDGYWGFIGNDIFSQYYYRYKIDWINLTVVLFFMILGLAWSCVQVAQLIYQLGVTTAITPFVAVLDVSTGQRTKKVLQKILSIFLVIISVAFMYRMFYLGIDFIQSIRDLPVLLETILIVGFSLGLIKGPDIIQELLGIDVGTSASNMFYTSQMIGGAVKTALGTPKNIANALTSAGRTGRKAINGASAVGGYYAGKAQGLWEHYQNQKAQNNDDNMQTDKENISSAGLFWNDKLKSADRPLLENKDGTLDKPLDNNHMIDTNNPTDNIDNNSNNSVNDSDSNIDDTHNINNIPDNTVNQNDNIKNDELNTSVPNISDNASYNADTTTTLKDIAKQKFDNSVLSPKDIVNTYNKARQIGINTVNSNIEKRKMLKDIFFKNWNNHSNISGNHKSNQTYNNTNNSHHNNNKNISTKQNNKIANNNKKMITTKEDRKFIERNDKK